MSTKPQIGRNEYNAAIVKGREANTEIRVMLRRIMQETSSSLIQALAGKIALAVGDSDEAIERLNEIGRTLKEE